MIQTRMESGTRSSENTASLPVFTTTPYGVCAHLPIIKFDDKGHLVAILFTTCTAQGTLEYPRLIGLALRPCSKDGADPLRPLYHTGFRDIPENIHPPSYRRLVDISRSARNINRQWEFKGWKAVYIVPAQEHPPHSPHSTGPSPLPGYHRSIPFRIPQRYLRALEDQGLAFRWSVSTTLEHSVLDWSEDNQVATLILLCATGFKDISPPLYISFGSCFKHARNPTAHGLGHAWLSIKETRNTTHDCTTDHVDGLGLPHLTKKWVYDHGDLLRNTSYCHYYTMSLSLCPVHPDTTYVIHLTATEQPPRSLRELELYNTVPSMSSFWEAAVKDFMRRATARAPEALYNSAYCVPLSECKLKSLSSDSPRLGSYSQRG